MLTLVTAFGRLLPARSYLDAAGGKKHMHYYLQLSEGDPKTDPITLCELHTASYAGGCKWAMPQTYLLVCWARDEWRSRVHEPERGL